MKKPDVAAVMRGLKDFQRDTVEYIYQRLFLDGDNQRRFLIADEVGLGKTLVARGLIAKAIDSLWDKADRIDVVYICSNASIARQNINRLNVTGEESFEIASRITLLPVTIRDLKHRRLNFISFTPGTSFDLKSSLGQMDERALLFWLLTRAWKIGGKAPLNVLQGNAEPENFRRRVEGFERENEIDESLAEEFARSLKLHDDHAKSEGRDTLRSCFDKLCGQFGRIRQNIPWEESCERREFVGKLRELLATTCLRALKPDLVILDEFQRFRHLLDGTDQASDIARDFFEHPEVRLILLSATPYKMLTLQTDHDDGEDHYEDFLRTVKFLQDDAVATERFKVLLAEYRLELLRIGNHGTENLKRLGRLIEHALRRVISRTERLAESADRNGMLEVIPCAPILLDLRADAIGTISWWHQADLVSLWAGLGLNRFVENTLHQQLLNLQSQHVYNGAAVIIDNATGDVLALVGSEDYFSPMAGQVNAAWSLRSPGSTFKPFTYLLALEHGDTPATIVADVPTEFATATGLFAPVNYNRHCYGPMRYRLALANSLNISAVKVLASIGGPEPLQHLLQQCGLSTLSRPPEQYGLGLTIGNAEARLLELANAYACLARLGQYKPYRLLTPAQGAPSLGNSRQVADASAAYLIADILSDNAARSLAFDAESSLRFDFPVACKTGTSSSFRDNWAFGYTPEFTAGVWIGNADGTSMEHVSGVTGAAPILHEIFEQLHQRYGTTWYSQPTNVVECRIHPITGKRLAELATAAASGDITEKFLARNLPPLERADDYQMQSAGIRAVRLGSEFREWFATGDNWLGDLGVLSESVGSLRILFPPPGTTIYLDADLPDQGRRMDLRAAGPDHLVWHSGTLKLIREGDRKIAILSEGRHQISVRDPSSGNEARTWIDVRVR